MNALSQESISIYINFFVTLFLSFFFFLWFLELFYFNVGVCQSDATQPSQPKERSRWQISPLGRAVVKAGWGGGRRRKDQEGPLALFIHTKKNLEERVSPSSILSTVSSQRGCSNEFEFRLKQSLQLWCHKSLPIMMSLFEGDEVELTRG